MLHIAYFKSCVMYEWAKNKHKMEMRKATKYLFSEHFIEFLLLVYFHLTNVLSYWHGNKYVTRHIRVTDLG